MRELILLSFALPDRKHRWKMHRLNDLSDGIESDRFIRTAEIRPPVPETSPTARLADFGISADVLAVVSPAIPKNETGLPGM